MYQEINRNQDYFRPLYRLNIGRFVLKWTVNHIDLHCTVFFFFIFPIKHF